jgi:serine/threonine protein kinase/Tfp pilus assembly protein PilF
MNRPTPMPPPLKPPLLVDLSNPPRPPKLPLAARAKALFDAVSEVPEGDLDEFLAKHCGDDDELAQRVRQLLSASKEAGSFLEAGAPEMTPEIRHELARLRPEEPGDWVGQYKLLQKIGAGSFGVVWMAEQETPIRRRVALKVIKVGSSDEVIARFDQERQALAVMDHPNIAKVLDAGVTPNGRPHVVMELIRGIPITEYSDSEKLSTAERLRLFIQVCRGVQHAHQKGVVHRDIKPANVLVTVNDDVPVPKIIDFGVAKALQQPLGSLPFFTHFEMMIGTPLYMSPEQAGLGSLDIDTRSDIYSLGVLLYELLTGRTPFDKETLTLAATEEMRRIIREEEPKKPSTQISRLTDEALTTAARVRRTVPPKLASLVRGDLDWVVMKALEKDRRRRYETANAFAEDLQRHLECQPVEARPPGTLYRFGRLVRRNRIAFAAAVLVTLCVTAGLTVSMVLMKEARLEAAKSGQVAHLLKDMLHGVGPSVALGRDTKLLREILDRTAADLERRLQQQPEVEAELRSTLGQIYRQFGEYQQAEAMHRRALLLSRACFGAESLETAQAMQDLGDAVQARGRLPEAEALQRDTAALLEKKLGRDHPALATCLNNLAITLQGQHRWDEAEALHRRALAIRKTGLPATAPDVAISLGNLGNVLYRQGKPAEAEAVELQGLELFRQHFGEEHLTVASAMDNLANVHQAAGKLTEAEALRRRALGIFRRLLPAGHPELANATENLASVLQQQGQFAEAEDLHRQALAVFRSRPDSQYAALLTTLENLAEQLKRRNREPEADALEREARDVRAAFAAQTRAP